MNNRPRFLRFTTQDQISFAKRLGMILRSGTSLLTGLQMLEAQAGNSSATFIYSQITREVAQGKTLTQAFESCGVAFSPFSINLIRVGERSGTLAQHLLTLAEELKKRELLTKRVIGALIYPLIILIATIGISVALTVFIFPKIVPLFEGFKEQLPLSTRVLMTVSRLLSNDWGWLLAGMICIGFTTFLLLRINRVRIVVDTSLLRMPLIGSLIRDYNLILISRTLGLLLAADVSPIEALQLTENGLPNSLYRAEFKKTQTYITRGQTFSNQLSQNPLLFPTMFVQMLRVGEQTGDLPATLLYLSDMYEEELNELIKNMTTLIEPILMVVMGLVVGFIALSIITPIYTITQNLNHYQ